LNLIQNGEEVSNESRREELIRVGLELFSARPYHEVSIDDLAAAAGVSKGLLYHYFPGKRDLYVALIRAAVEEMREVTAPQGGPPGPDRLRRSLDAYLDFVEHREQGFRAVLQGGIGADREIWQITEEMRALTVERVLQGLGVERPRPVLRSVLRGWVGFLEATSLDWLAHRDLARDQLLDLLTLALGSALEAAQRVDPEVEFELPAPARSS
jgi:AcrR family transcriptional regulator